MPTYDYKCLECSHTFEEFHAMNAPSLDNCHECGGKVKKLIGAGSGLIFKGSGFYITDYKNKDTDKKETVEKSDSAGKSADKSASKTSETSEKKKSADTTTAKSSK